MRPALIHNPRSRRNQRDGDRFLAFAQKKLGEFCVCSQHDEYLADYIRDLKKKNVDFIVINGGDGTVSACLTVIADVYPKDNLPAVAILPAGNTNLIASDVGFGLRGKEAVERLLTGKPFRSSERAPIRLSWSDKAGSVLGMFGGCTGYARAIQIAHEPTVARFAPHGLAVFYTLCTSILNLLFSRSRQSWMNGNAFTCDVSPPCDVSGKTSRSFLFMVTALEKLAWGIWPFWNKEKQHDGFYFLNVESFPKRLASAVANLLTSRAPEWLQNHKNYASGRATKFALETDSDFVLDGEVFPAQEGQKVILEKGPVFRFFHV